jgi:hypothetical protein
MKLKTLLLINTVVAAVFGLALVIVPGTVTATYGITADAAMRYMSQLYGASLLGVATLCWYATDAPESEARTGIIRGLFLFNAVSLFVSLVAQFSGVMNAVNWSAVAIYLLFTLGWAYFVWVKPAA